METCTNCLTPRFNWVTMQCVSHGEGWVTDNASRKSNHDKKEQNQLTVFFREKFAIGGVLYLGFISFFSVKVSVVGGGGGLSMDEH